MDRLDIINANINLTSAIQSMQISLQEVKEKRPESSYIQGLEKHIKQLSQTLLVFSELDKINRNLTQMNFNYHKENMELKYENEQLNNTIKNLLEGI